MKITGTEDRVNGKTTKYGGLQWCYSFIVISIFVFLALSMVNYIIDPFLQYRFVDGKRFMEPRFVSLGLEKTYDYDTIIIGSSMSANFDMNYVADAMGCKPLKIAIGGITLGSVDEAYSLAHDVGKADTYYINVDIWKLLGESTDYEWDNKLFPQHQMTTGSFDIAYTLGYENWFKYIPIDIAAVALDNIGLLPESVKKRCELRYLARWDSNYGADSVFANETTEVIRPENDVTGSRDEYTRKNIDRYLSIFDFKSDDEIVFFFPPYSALYWEKLERAGNLEYNLAAKDYFVERASELGAKVFCFWGADITTDLNYYCDFEHYSPEINEWMVDMFLDGQYIENIESLDKTNQSIRENIEIVEEKYSEYLK